MSLQRVAFNPLHTFTRATNETFFNQVVDSFGNVSYQLQTAPAGTAVQNAYSTSTGEPLGLQVFEQRTNLLTYSEQFNDASWTKSRSEITANAITSPDGTLTADKFIMESGAAFDSVDGAGFVTKTVAVTNAPYTLSVFAKAAEFSSLTINYRDNTSVSNQASATFSLVNGTITSAASVTGTFVSASAKIEDVGNGWYRASLTATPTGATSVRFRFWEGTSTGDGTSGFYLWGAQLEAGAFPTPYIKTEATTATRNASVAVINNINTSEWWNSSEGEIIVYWRANVSSSSAEVITISDGTTANRIGIRKDTSNNILIINTASGTTATISSGAKLSGLNVTRLKYTPSGIVASSNGGAEVQINATTPLPVLNRINIGSSATGTLLLNGNIAKLIYTPSAGA